MDYQTRKVIALERRSRCLRDNNFRCNTCHKKFDRDELFTMPVDEACFCKSCWLGGEYKAFSEGW